MKNKFIYTGLMVLALASGCIQEEGVEPFTTTRQVRDAAKSDTIPLTVVTGAKGFMYGEAPKDSIVENSFQTILSVNKNIENLDCYITMHSEFRKLDLERNAVKEAGFVYSYTTKNPLCGDLESKVFSKKDIYYNPDDSTKTDIAFEGTGHNLEFNKPIFLRSYVVTCKGDTIYNPRVVETRTVLPEDVWFQRNDAPADLTGRTDCFCVTNGDNTYIYGGRSGQQCYNDLWVYDKKHDTWQQKATFDKDGTYYSNKQRRCNGAAFAYPRKGVDTLIYIAGGQLHQTLEPTNTVFFYSTRWNRFANPEDHPNHSKEYDLYDSNGQPIYMTDDNGNYVLDASGQKIHMKGTSPRNHVEDLPVHDNIGQPRGIYGCVGFTLPDDVMDDGYRVFVAYGKTNRQDVRPVETEIYEYDVTYDRTSNNPLEPSTLAWRTHSAGNDKTAQGFYQPVCVNCGDRVVIGSGESSRNNNKPCKAFYTISYVDQEIRLTQLPAPPEEFKSRANAAGFYLNYVKDGQSYDRFFVGTGRTVSEDDFKDDHTQLLNDLWCYDFTRKAWIKRANCSNIYRQGACGFTVLRNDDYYFNTFGENERGYFSFGEGAIYDNQIEQWDYKYGLQDNWEYLP